MANVWRPLLRWITRMIGLALDAIGVAGLPGDWRTWGAWLESLNETYFRVFLVVLGTLIFAATFLPWKRWFSNKEPTANAPPPRIPRGADIIQTVQRSQRTLIGGHSMSGSHGSVQAGRDVVFYSGSSTATDRSQSWRRLMEDFEDLQRQGLKVYVKIITNRDGWESWNLAATDQSLVHRFEALSQMAGKRLAATRGPGVSNTPERIWYRKVGKPTRIYNPPAGPARELETLSSLVDRSVDACRDLAEREEGGGG